MTDPECVGFDGMSIPGITKRVVCARTDPPEPTTPDPDQPTQEPTQDPGGASCNANPVSRTPCRITDLRYSAHNWLVKIESPNYGGSLNSFQPGYASVGGITLGWCDTPANFPGNSLSVQASYWDQFGTGSREYLGLFINYRQVGNGACLWQLGTGDLVYEISSPPVIGQFPTITRGYGKLSNIQVVVSCSFPTTYEITGTLVPAAIGSGALNPPPGGFNSSSFFNQAGCPINTLSGSFKVIIKES